jgi:hypothetical protein
VQCVCSDLCGGVGGDCVSGGAARDGGFFCRQCTTRAVTTAVSYAVAGAAANVASQAVNLAGGNQDKFSWRQVGIAAISAGVTQGAGGVGASGSIVSAVVTAAVNSVVSQAIGSALGIQSFSWRGVAAAAVTAGVVQAGSQLINAISGGTIDLSKAEAGSSNPSDTGGAGTAQSPSNNTMATVARNVIGILGAVAGSAVQNKGKVEWRSVAINAVGNSIGAVIVERYQQYQRDQQSIEISESITARKARETLAVIQGEQRPAPQYQLSADGFRLPGIGGDDSWRIAPVAGSSVIRAGQPLADIFHNGYYLSSNRTNYRPLNGSILYDAGSTEGLIGLISDGAASVEFEGNANKLKLRSAPELRDGLRAAWNGLYDSANFALMLGRNALKLYDTNADGSPNLKSVLAPVLTRGRFDYESEAYRSNQYGLATGAELVLGGIATAAAFKGFSKVAGGLNSQFAQKLKGIEDNILRATEGTMDEILVIVDPKTGLEYLSKRLPDITKGPGSVGELIPYMKGKVVTHNHPLGGTFSIEDIKTALLGNTLEFRAVTQSKTYSLKFSDDAPKNLLGNSKEINLFAHKEVDAIKDKFFSLLAQDSKLNLYALSLTSSERKIFQSNFMMDELTRRNPWMIYTKNGG